MIEKEKTTEDIIKEEFGEYYDVIDESEPETELETEEAFTEDLRRQDLL